MAFLKVKCFVRTYRYRDTGTYKLPEAEVYSKVCRLISMGTKNLAKASETLIVDRFSSLLEKNDISVSSLFKGAPVKRLFSFGNFIRRLFYEKKLSKKSALFILRL